MSERFVISEQELDGLEIDIADALIKKGDLNARSAVRHAALVIQDVAQLLRSKGLCK